MMVRIIGGNNDSIQILVIIFQENTIIMVSVVSHMIYEVFRTGLNQRGGFT